jgi:plastocyanin
MRWTLSLAGAVLVGLMISISCNSSSTPASNTPVTPADVTIAINGMSFSASPAIKVGQTVSWKNNDTTTHTATSDTGLFNTGNIAPGATSTPITMTTAGTLNYHCILHPMASTLNVQ